MMNHVSSPPSTIRCCLRVSGPILTADCVCCVCASIRNPPAERFRADVFDSSLRVRVFPFQRGVSNGTPLARRFTNWARELKEQSSELYKPVLIGYTDAPTDPRGLPLDHPELQHWDGGYLDGFENLTEDSTMGSAAWLTAVSTQTTC